MSPESLPVFRRPRADADLVEAVLWLRENASPAIAVDFVDRVEEALALLSRHPLAGSGLVGIRLGIPGLRSFHVTRTPYVLLYLADSRRVDLVRVLHGRRDVDADLIDV
ncbi:MAG: type II toxin-antitoxin system RelE/ParE family toxin [Longimicrobiales bacterium]